MKTGLITSDTSQNHDTGPGHPEQIARVSVIVGYWDQYEKQSDVFGEISHWKKSGQKPNRMLCVYASKKW